MLTCKQVSKALSESDYEKLSPLRKFFLKLHVKLCVFCGKYNRQVMTSQDMCRCYKQHEDSLESVRPKLEESKKEEMRRLLAKESGEKH